LALLICDPLPTIRLIKDLHLKRLRLALTRTRLAGCLVGLRSRHTLAPHDRSAHKCYRRTDQALIKSLVHHLKLFNLLRSAVTCQTDYPTEDQMGEEELTSLNLVA